MECLVLAQMNVSYKVTVHDLVNMETQLEQLRHMNQINCQVLASLSVGAHPHLFLMVRELLEHQFKIEAILNASTSNVNKIYKEILEACREQSQAD